MMPAPIDLSPATLYRLLLVWFAERAFQVHEPGRTFVPSWHHHAIAFELQQCLSGHNRRLIVNQPPRTLKSYLIAIAFSAWHLGSNPGAKILIVCYSEDLAKQHSRAVRRIMRSPWYCALFPHTIIADDKDSESHFETTQGGQCRAVSVAGQITGFGYDIIIIDDPMKAQDVNSETERRKLEETYASTISSRLNAPATGIIIVVMQRLHVDDFTEYLLRSKQWRHLCIPAMAPADALYRLGEGKDHKVAAGDLLEPDRLPKSFLDEQQATQGALHYQAQYQQNPLASGTGLVRAEWFKRYQEQPSFDYTVITIDPAFTKNGGDYTAYLVCGIRGDDVVILHGDRVQIDFPTLRRWIKRLDQHWQPDLIVLEAIGSGLGLCQQLRDDGLDHIGSVLAESKLSKAERMEVVTPQIEQGRVWLPASGDFVQPFLNEMIAFPNGQHDDWVDALSQLLGYLGRVKMKADQARRRRQPRPEDTPPQQRRRSMYWQQFYV